MLPNIRILSLIVAAALATSVSFSHAESALVEDNAEQRINFSGKLRMLSQRIPSAACHLSRGIDVEGSSALLTAAPLEFEKILTALEFGDADLNIQNAETNRKSLHRIHELRAKWEPMKAAVERLQTGDASEDDLNFILTSNMEVLGAAVSLVSQLVKQYSNPNAVTHANLMLIDISGRQRMLTQKMSKEACIKRTDHNTPETTEHLAGTMRIFEASLEALRHGLPEAGINPPPNSVISDGLEVVHKDWQAVKPALVEILDGQSLTDEATAQKFQGLNKTMGDMNKVVGMYAEAAKPVSARE